MSKTKTEAATKAPAAKDAHARKTANANKRRLDKVEAALGALAGLLEAQYSQLPSPARQRCEAFLKSARELGG